MGDAVGHWEGDTLVVDIVGVKSFPYSMVDRFGVPVTNSLHLVERYRLIDGAAAKQAQDTYEKREGRVGGGAGAMAIEPDTNVKGLQIEITVEDPTMYTRTWSATATYRRGRAPWLEQICAEDTFNYAENKAGGNSDGGKIGTSEPQFASPNAAGLSHMTVCAIWLFGRISEKPNSPPPTRQGYRI
jgi:hypothetical protein